MIARDDLAATGVALVDDGEGVRVTPPSTVSLARAVAVARGYRLPLRIRRQDAATLHHVLADRQSHTLLLLVADERKVGVEQIVRGVALTFL